ncbi:unnamed protein product (macronuclear) [Paramecium tetraurelia]|uniref:EGF-like domain-containing protein n=1 Tax=Paramecium tetraurelia TaxID=5888 RepID=A0CQ00_PARTE|nr:uncharacterized protein GSPATT00038824001 [Paramecium tetraurelia]CAK72867.1 unnamed protein product [Paramecium tetraurelia]|eukprot:XP_001440264.1 hypothetical protein (macronuclear) [Paramecium tetraurelia strain d4-2]
MKYLFQNICYLILQTVLTQTLIDTFNQVDIKGIEFDWSARTLPIGDQQLLVAQNIRGYDQLFQVQLMIIDIGKNEIVRQITIGGVEESKYCPDILIMNNQIFIAFVSEKGSALNVVMKKFSLSLEETNVELNLGATIQEVKIIQKIQFIQINQLNKNLLTVLWYSQGKEYPSKQWNMILYNPTTGVKGEILILPDSEFVSVAQNKLGIIAIAQSNNNYIILSKLFEGKLTTRSIPTSMYGSYQQKIKIQSLSSNEFIVLTWKNSYDFTIRRFDKDFEANQSPQRIQTKEFCTTDRIQQIDVSFTDYQLILVSKCSEEIKIQQVDLLNVQNNKYITKQYRQIDVDDTKQNIQSIYIDQINHNKLLLRWFTPQFYYYALSVQLIDMGLKVNECIQNCNKCDNLIHCQECKQNYLLDTIKNRCNPICPDNCLYCSDASYCDRCKLGYQYTKENLCVSPTNDFMELKVSRETESKGKGKIINKDFFIIVIYSVYQSDKQQYLVIRKLDNQGQLLKKVELQQDQQTLLDYDIADSFDDDVFFILIKWATVDGTTKTINYYYYLEDLTIKGQSLITEGQPIIQGDQIKIINYKNQNILFFYFVKDKDYYQLLYRKMDQNEVYSNYSSSIFYYQGNFEMTSYKNSINYHFITIRNLDYYFSCNILDNQLQCNSETNKDTSEFFSQKIIQIDQISLYLEHDFYLNRQLYINNTDNYKVQLTQSSRYPQNHTFIQIGQNDIIVLWSGIINIQQSNPIYHIYIQGFSKKSNTITNLKSFTCSPACFKCSETGVCLQCKNSNYKLQNGKCKLLCINNCEQCSIEDQCLKCKLNYFLDSKSQCVQTEKNYIIQKAGYLYPTISQNQDGTVSIASFKNNGTKFDVVYEEFNRQGQSISGEIRISNDSNLTIILQQPQLIKQDQLILIQYLVRDEINSQSIKAIFVTLDQQYHIIQNNISILLNQDILIDNLLIDKNLYVVFSDSTTSTTYLYVNFYEIKQGCMTSQTQHYYGNVFTFTKRYQNFRLENLGNQNKFTIQFTELDAADQIVYLYDYVELKLTKSIITSYFVNYFTYLQLFSVQYKAISNKKLNLQFLNQRGKLLNNVILESINDLSKIQVVTSLSYIYLLYAESSQQSIININVKQYDLNGTQIAETQISSNEQSIDFLSGNNQQNEFLYITWSTQKYSKSYKLRLNQKLQAIPFDEEICVSHCGDCSNNNNEIMCTQCLDGYLYNEQKLKCSPICLDNCQKCTQPYTCDYCNNDFKFVDNKCLNVTQYQLEIPFCQQTCNGIGSILSFSDNSMITTFYNYKNSQHSLDSNIYQQESSVITTKQLISSETPIAYHRIYEYESKKFALIWLSGNCKVSCRMMLQLFQSSFVVITNPIEMRLIKVLNIDEFEIQIKIFNTNFVIVWTEIDENSLSQTYVGIYNTGSGFQIKQNINENQDDISINPQLLIQTSSYQIIYIKNNNIINSLTIDSTTTKYKQLYQSTNQIESISSDNIDSSGLAIGWIESQINLLGIRSYYAYIQYFDRQLNQQATKRIAINSYITIKSLYLNYIPTQYIQLTYIQIEKGEQQRIRVSFASLSFLKYGSSQEMLTSPLNILSQYQSNTKLLTYVDPRNYQSYVVFQGVMNNVNYIFFIQSKGTYLYQDNCETNCFYCNNKNLCVICKQGFTLQNNKCALKLPDYCTNGNYGRCSQCAVGYSVTSDYKCQISDSKYKEIKMSVYPAQSRQRISTLSNGDYVIVWSTQFYQNEGTGIYMSLYNSQGVLLKEQMRISESSAGIQQYPDVQVMSNDQIVVVWIDGNILVNANIKMLRFDKDFLRIGSETIVQTDIHLYYAQSYDTPVIIQSIINGFVIVWAEQGNQKQISLIAKFFDNDNNVLNTQIVTENEQIINEPVVASTQSIIVISWQTNKGVFASSYSVNQVLIDKVQLSTTGESPAIVSIDNSIIIAWKEYVIDENDFMSQKIRFRQVSADLNQYQVQSHFGVSQENLDNPDVISIENGFAIIAESVSVLDDKVRTIQMQLFNLDGSTKSQPVIIYSVSNLYPHHPQLASQPQGNFIASWTVSSLISQILSDDVYMKRYKNDGTQLALNTIICQNNCQTCSSSNICQSCKQNYILLSNSCYLKINNCEAHSIENLTITCSQCSNGFELIKNNCYQINTVSNEQTNRIYK